MFSPDSTVAEPLRVSTTRVGVLALALCVITWLLFSRALAYPFLDYDDPDYVTQNAQVQSGLTLATVRWAFTSTAAGNWHPLTWLSHALDCQSFGDDPRGHHAVNIFWHGLNAAMAFLALRRLTGAFWTSAVCAALFAWHPLRVESVAWIAERKDVLSAFFGLLTLWAYAVFAEASRSHERRAWKFYSLALMAYALGLMCKPMLVTLPFVLMLLDHWPLRRLSARALLEKLPFLLLSAAVCVVTYLAQHKAGAVVETTPITSRLANAAVSVATYLRSFLWPFDLAVGYARPAQWPVSVVAAAMFVLGVLSAIAVGQFKTRPFLLVGWLWFLGMLVPVIGLVQAGLQARADRYTYLPVIGVEIALFWLMREFAVTARLRRFVIAGAAVALIGCAVRTWDQLAVWRSSEALYTHALSVDPDNYLAHCYLGSTLFNERRLVEAQAHFTRAIELKPDYAAAHDRLGLALEKTGHPQEALAHYQRALAIGPSLAATQLRLANALASLDRDAEAVEHYREALRLEPRSAAAHRWLGDSLRALNNFRDARAEYQIALALRPKDEKAHYGLGAALEGLGENDLALASYLEATQLSPTYSEAHYNAAVLLLARNDPEKAHDHFSGAANTDPRWVQPRIGVGLAAEQLGRPQEAAACYELALKLEPTFPGLAEKLAEARRQAVASAARP